MNKALQKERLLKLAWLLENLEDEFPARKVRFNLSGWAYKSPSCNTFACACGWAGLHPWFRRRGFITDITDGDVHYRDHFGFNAVERFFSLNFPTAQYLFSISSYSPGKADRQNVTRRIRAYVRDHFSTEDKIKPRPRSKPGITDNPAVRGPAVRGVDDITLLEE